jgi:hypothetical protein
MTDEIQWREPQPEETYQIIGEGYSIDYWGETPLGAELDLTVSIKADDPLFDRLLRAIQSDSQEEKRFIMSLILGREQRYE